jgi:hypothetical protein
LVDLPVPLGFPIHPHDLGALLIHLCKYVHHVGFYYISIFGWSKLSVACLLPRTGARKRKLHGKQRSMPGKTCQMPVMHQRSQLCLVEKPLQSGAQKWLGWLGKEGIPPGSQ